jgi:hypothetical protein
LFVFFFLLELFRVAGGEVCLHVECQVVPGKGCVCEKLTAESIAYCNGQQATLLSSPKLNLLKSAATNDVKNAVNWVEKMGSAIGNNVRSVVSGTETLKRGALNVLYTHDDVVRQNQADDAVTNAQLALQAGDFNHICGAWDDVNCWEKPGPAAVRAATQGITSTSTSNPSLVQVRAESEVDLSTEYNTRPSGDGSKKSRVRIPHCVLVKGHLQHCGHVRLYSDHPLAVEHASKAKSSNTPKTNSRRSTSPSSHLAPNHAGVIARLQNLSKHEKNLSEQAKKNGNYATAFDHKEAADKYDAQIKSHSQN